jgi:hypothetical protein
MTDGRAVVPVSALAIFLLMAAGGCSDGLFTGEMTNNILPVIQLTNGPIEGDTTSYRVHFFWYASDEDGSVDHYEFVLVEGNPIGFDPADTTGSGKWSRTKATDSLFIVEADNHVGNTTIDNRLYGKFQKTHTFFIRAVDDRGGVSEAAYRSFTAHTLAPMITITSPRHSNVLSAQNLSLINTFKWHGKDPIDSPWNYQPVDSVRYFYREADYDIVADLNSNPERYEHFWSPWVSYDAPGDSGTTTVIGDDELLEPLKTYAFVLQGKDEAGAVSSVFDRRKNVRLFIPQKPTGPHLTIYEPYLGRFNFIGVTFLSSHVKVPPGFEMNFTWTGSADLYGGVVASFRYGWDIADLNEPSDWNVSPSPYIREAPPATFFSGVHKLYVETTDNFGVKTLGIIEVTIIPIIMTRDLLWVDDLPSYNFTQLLFAYPTESEHDEFWLDICLNSRDFEPNRDIYDVTEHNLTWPPMELVWKYKNIIWTFSGPGDPNYSIWNDLVRYTPEGTVGQNATLNLNFLTYYLAFGGHLWTSGIAGRTGGLMASVFNVQIPCYLRCEFYSPSVSCGSKEGENTMPYRDFCVSVVDKVDGQPRPGEPNRDPLREGLAYAVIDDTDSLTLQMEGFPEKIELWSNVTSERSFFYPGNRGFTFVEIYDPQYWMWRINQPSQPCFHPLYRNVARNTRSYLHMQPLAFAYTKYADVVPTAPGGVAAPSFHFGIPLWYFNRAQSDSIAQAIFNVWQIPLLDD